MFNCQEERKNICHLFKESQAQAGASDFPFIGIMALNSLLCSDKDREFMIFGFLYDYAHLNAFTSICKRTMSFNVLLPSSFSRSRFNASMLRAPRRPDRTSQTRISDG